MKKVILALLGIATAPLSAQEVSFPSADREDAEIVVTATRTPELFPAVGSSYTVISLDDLEESQRGDLKQSITVVPGLSLVATGTRGAANSLFLRGTNSDQVLFLIDGVRVSDPNTDYLNFLGSASLLNLERVEVIRGPQSSLYGGEAIGGVIALTSSRGRGEPRGALSLEAGSFKTFSGALAVHGEWGRHGLSFGLGYDRTENDRPNNDFENTSYSLRYDFAATETVNLGATLRGYDMTYGSPGDRFTNDPDNEEREEGLLTTAFAELQATEVWYQKLVLAYQRRRFVSEDPSFNAVSVTNNDRYLADWHHVVDLHEDHRLSLGGTMSQSLTESSVFGDIDEEQTELGLYLQDQWSVSEALTLTGGLRWDDYDTFGDEITYRVAAAYYLAASATKLRASYGTGFRAPSFLELFAVSDFFVGNPELGPEKSQGFDVGLDQYFGEGTHLVSLTYFRNDLEDLIATDFGAFPATSENVEEATTQGIEVSARGEIVEHLHYQFAYAYLEAEDDTNAQRLLRRPRHAVSADLRYVAEKWIVGAGVLGIIDREDIDAQSFARVSGDDYWVARLYGSYQILESLTAKARIENLLDEDYEEVNGYPALGIGLYGGVEWRF